MIWQSYLIDGHHRYAICRKYNIPFKTVEKLELENELDVKLWMIKNQFSRRNLPTETRLALAYKFKEFEAEKAKNCQLANLKQFSEEETSEIKQSTVSPPVDIRENNQDRTLGAIAKMAGVGHTALFLSYSFSVLIVD